MSLVVGWPTGAYQAETFRIRAVLHPAVPADRWHRGCGRCGHDL